MTRKFIGICSLPLGLEANDGYQHSFEFGEVEILRRYNSKIRYTRLSSQGKYGVINSNMLKGNEGHKYLYRP